MTGIGVPIGESLSHPRKAIKQNGKYLLFKGISTKKLRQIEKEGLNPPDTWTTPDPGIAWDYADHRAETTGGSPAICKVIFDPEKDTLKEGQPGGMMYLYIENRIPPRRIKCKKIEDLVTEGRGIRDELEKWMKVNGG